MLLLSLGLGQGRLGEVAVQCERSGGGECSGRGKKKR